MILLELAATVCRTFTEQGTERTRTVQTVKAGHSRDVVTTLDTTLHAVTERFVAAHMPGCTLLSEEGATPQQGMPALAQGEWLIVDPLDGSSNHAMGLPHHGYMATHLREGVILGALLVLPEHDQYLIAEGATVRTARPLVRPETPPRGGIYYAYPPRQDAAARETRAALTAWIDDTSAGMYRYGAACVGLYQVARGAHRAFIGHQLRLWDAIAALPILTALGIDVRYRIDGETITLVAGAETALVGEGAAILARGGAALIPYRAGDPLRGLTP